MASLVLPPTTGGDALAAMSSSFVVMAEDSIGAGFLVAPTIVVTAAHVVGDSARVQLSSGAPEPIQAEGTVVASDAVRDVAVIRVDEPLDAPPLPWASSPARVGDTVYAVGSPIGQLVASQGVVVAVSTASIEATTPVDPGSSGGPLLTETGAVLGVVSQESRVTGNSFSVPTTVIRDVVASIPVAATPSAGQDYATHGRGLGLLGAATLVATVIVGLVVLATTLIVTARRREQRHRDRIIIRLD